MSSGHSGGGRSQYGVSGGGGLGGARFTGPSAAYAHSNRSASPGGYHTGSRSAYDGRPQVDYGEGRSRQPQHQRPGPQSHGGPAYDSGRRGYTQQHSGSSRADDNPGYDYYGSKGYDHYYGDSGGRYDEAYFSSKDEQDQAVRKVHHQIEETKDQSLASTKNMLSVLGSAHDIQSNVLNNLDQQNENLKHVENTLYQTEVNNARASHKTNILKRENRAFFLPRFRMFEGKEKKIQRKKKAYEEGDSGRGGKGSSSGKGGSDVTGSCEGGYQSETGPYYGSGGGGGTRQHLLPHEEDDAKEAEINSNLDQISTMLHGLKMGSLAMQDKIGKSNRMIDSIGEDATRATAGIQQTHKRLDRIVKK